MTHSQWGRVVAIDTSDIISRLQEITFIGDWYSKLITQIATDCNVQRSPSAILQIWNGHEKHNSRLNGSHQLPRYFVASCDQMKPMSGESLE